MFHPGKKSGQDRNKNTAKFLDQKRDTHARLKSLKNLLDLLVENEIKEFFETYSSELFFVFYEEFTNAELNAKSKGAKLKDELEELLALLEKIFINLPDKIHSKWHFNTIGLILRKLLHHGNIQTIRELALRLFMLWLQILQENIDDLNLAIFGSIVPCFPSPITELMKNNSLSRPQKEIEYLITCVNGQGYMPTIFTSNLESETEWCLSESCHAVCPPQQGEKVQAPEDLTKGFLDKVLDCLPRRMLDIRWNNLNMRESGFYYLFLYFKRFYLKHIFPLWDPQISRLYSESAELLAVPITTDVQNSDIYQKNGLNGGVLLSCQRAVLFWLIVFTSRLKQRSAEVIKSHQSSDLHRNSLPGVEVPPPSKTYDMLCLAADIVRTVLFSTQENVTVVHEIFRQGLLMPLNCADTMNHILAVYKEWIFKIPERPSFMLEPKQDQLLSPEEMLLTADCSPMLRSPSYREAVQSCEQLFFSNMPVENVRAGLQPSMRLFIAISSQVFFLKQKQELVVKHVDVCKRIIKIFRNIVLEMHLDAQTWRQLLDALLKITDYILVKKPLSTKSSTLGGQLAGYLLQTLFVTWIRASLEVYLTKELWDELLRVLKSLTNWEELIKEWASTMDTLTRVMAKTVYGIDLLDPPLEKLTHRSKVKKFGLDKSTRNLSLDQSAVSNKNWNYALSNSEFLQEKPHISKTDPIIRCISEPGDLHILEPIQNQNSSNSPKKLLKQQNVQDDKTTFTEMQSSQPLSFDSINSNNFMHSMSSDIDLKSEYPKNQLDADLDSEEHNDVQVSYTRLKGDTDSELSLLNIPTSRSLASISSYLSESSQNLLSFEFGINEEEKLNAIVSNNSMEYSQLSKSFLSAENFEATSRTSLLSENNLISFEIDVVKETSKCSADAESIDSHKFSLIDNDNFNDLKSPTSFTQSEISEEQFENTVSVAVSHVRFAAVDTNRINFFEEDCCEEDDREENSVINGGDIKGWTKISSMILWQRILCIMGNVNEIKDPEIHADVFKQLIQIWSMLETVKRNQGISIDNKQTPAPPKLTPPLFFCSTWCFQAVCSGSVTHKPGIVLAYKLACKMIVKSHGLKPSVDQLLYFFRTIHTGLVSFDQDIVNAIIGECATIFSLSLEGLSCLITEFISACNTIISAQFMNCPRREAIIILGSLICFPSAFPEMKILQPGITSEPKSVILGKEIREMVLGPLLKAAKCDPSCRTRCIALCCLGVFVVDSLIHLGGHFLIYDCVSLLVGILALNCQVVSTVALDVLFTLTFYYKEMRLFDNSLPQKIVMGICQVVHHLLESSPAGETRSSPEFLSKLVLCLLEWLMVIPQEDVLKCHVQEDGALSYFGLAMKAFNECCRQPSSECDSHHVEHKPINIDQLFIIENHLTQIECVHDDLQEAHDLNSYDSSFLSNEVDERRNRMVKLTAEYAIAQVLNFFHLFPFYTGAVRPSSIIIETDDHFIEENQLLEATNVQYLLLDETILLTLLELPQVEYFKRNTNLEGLKTISRFILRDATGKYCWDVTDIFKPVESDLGLIGDYHLNKKQNNDRKHSRNLSISGMRLPSSSSSLLPTWETVDPNTDRVDQLLRYIGQSSPECLLYPDQPLNMPAPVPVPLNVSLQPLIVTSVLKQHNEEENYVHEVTHDHRINATDILPPTFHEPTSEYHLSKILMHQLGYFTSDKRKSIELLERNEKLLRDIKNLDNRPSRETHKIAVFYVAPGQEDKTSILLNSQGSAKFEDFVRGMSWEVSLADHTGFMGGLEKNLSTGATAPYFATHSLEMIFHVSTRIPGGDEDSLKTKLRHLGNDEIHIIWCEHSRDFRRGIINTEFGDVLIIIYPLKNSLYRIQIDCKEKIPPFGPLFDGAIIDEKLLPLLVRSTAISAGRAKRTTIPLYNQHFEERARCIREISKNRVRPTSFEEFCSNLYSPGVQFEDSDNQDGLSRALSLPTRKTSLNDSVLRILDLPDQTFRERVGSTLTKKQELQKFPKSKSNTSLNLPEVEDNDPKDYKDRRRSIPKKFKNKLKTSFASDLPGVMEKTP